jgi:probable HAF family extracellular repeat protein
MNCCVRRKTWRQVAWLWFALGLAQPATAQTAYTVVDLGTLGGARSAAQSINEAGQVAGFAENNEGRTRAFIYLGGTPLELGTLGGDNSYAYRISDTGLVVGRAQNADGIYRPFLASVGGPLLDLSSLDSRAGAQYGAALGINRAGRVVGYVQSPGGHMESRNRVFAFRDYHLTDFGAFGAEDGVVTAINDADQMVGYYSRTPHADYADHQSFVRSGNALVPLGNLGGRITTATDINARGQVVGHGTTRGGELHGFFYEGGVIRDLGTLPNGTQSAAYAINDQGEIVGRSDGDFAGVHAVLCRGGVMQDLNSLIPSTAGWTLMEARAINNAGQIVGTGLHHGLEHAYLLIPVD